MLIMTRGASVYPQNPLQMQFFWTTNHWESNRFFTDIIGHATEHAEQLKT